MNDRMIRPRNQNKSRCRHGARRGAAAIEFAFVAPFLFLMLVGMMEFGRAMNVEQILTESARAGVREAILDGATETSVAAVVDNYANTASLTGLSTPVITIEGDEDGTLASAVPGDMVTVSVSVPFNSVTRMFDRWFASDLNLSASATMRKEGFE